MHMIPARSPPMSARLDSNILIETGEVDQKFRLAFGTRSLHAGYTKAYHGILLWINKRFM